MDGALGSGNTGSTVGADVGNTFDPLVVWPMTFASSDAANVSSDARLASVVFSPSSLRFPFGFHPETLHYTSDPIPVASDVATIGVFVECSNPKCKITFPGRSNTIFGSPASTNLTAANVIANGGMILVQVTAETGSVTRTYRFKFDVQSLDDVLLASYTDSLGSGDVFDPVIDHSFTVPAGTTRLSFTAIARSPLANLTTNLSPLIPPEAAVAVAVQPAVTKSVLGLDQNGASTVVTELNISTYTTASSVLTVTERRSTTTATTWATAPAPAAVTTVTTVVATSAESKTAKGTVAYPTLTRTRVSRNGVPSLSMLSGTDVELNPGITSFSISVQAGAAERITKFRFVRRDSPMCFGVRSLIGSYTDSLFAQTCVIRHHSGIQCFGSDTWGNLGRGVGPSNFG